MFPDKSDFAYGIKLKFLRWGDCHGSSQPAQYNHKGPYRSGRRGGVEEGAMMTEAEARQRRRERARV